MVEAEELRKFYDFQTSKHAIASHILLTVFTLLFPLRDYYFNLIKKAGL